jgi:predicted ATP-grasp superfamily ATP-dependent carboligase
MTTAAEFFISETHKLLFLQTRTPLYNNLYEEFCQEIVDFIKAECISELVIISSTFSYEQHFIDKSPFEYVKNEIFESAIPQELFALSKDSLEKELPGSGVALSLFQKATENDIQSVILYKYVSEGDNRQDAFAFLMRINSFLNNPISEKTQIREPPSWQFLFGNSVRTEIY